VGERVLWALRHDLPGESDEQLTDRARQGDQSAFGELYRRHRKAAESTAWCLLRSKSDADDIVSDAFAGVLSALHNGRGPRDNFRGYLLACVRNGCRSRRTPTVLVDESQLERWNPAVEDPERYVEADTVARAFSSLAPRWQHTLWMTEVEQLHPTEVSERLDLTPNAAAALTHRARQAFAEAYLAEHLVVATGKECRKVAALLPGYVRHQLRDLQQATVERHIVNCQLCARAVDDLRDVNASLRSLLPLTPAALGTAAAATEAVVAGTTIGGGLSIGLPSSGVLLKGLIAVVLVAPILSTDSPFSGRGGDDQRAVSVLEAEVDAASSGDAAAPVSVSATDPAPTVAVTVTAPATTAPPATATTAPDEDAASGGGERPTATAVPTIPPATSPLVTIPVTIPVTAPSGLLPNVPVVGGLVDDLLEDTVEPVIGAVTEPVVAALDEALALMGLGSTGETITMLRSLVPLLDGPLLGSVVDELLDLTSIGTGPPASPPGSAPGASDGVVPDGVDIPGVDIPGVDVPGGEGSVGGVDSAGGGPSVSVPGVPGAELPLPTLPGAPQITLPAVSAPVISVPPIVVPVISVPPITVPILDLPPINLPVISLPPITLPAIVIPPITIPDLLG
jgi:RNA polymerase sigma factor (sigma-70 family)